MYWASTLSAGASPLPTAAVASASFAAAFLVDFLPFEQFAFSSCFLTQAADGTAGNIGMGVTTLTSNWQEHSTERIALAIVFGVPGRIGIGRPGTELIGVQINGRATIIEWIIPLLGPVLRKRVHTRRHNLNP